MPDSLQSQFSLKIEEKVTDFVGQPYTNILQAALFRDIVEIFENEGYPLCKVITIGFDLDSVKREKTGFILRIGINPGPLIRVTGLQLPPKSDLNVRYLEQTFRFRKNEIYNDQRVQRYDRILKKQDFIKQSSPPSIIVGKNNLYYLQLNYVESPFTTFDGIVGYIPPPVNDPTESGFFTGLINLSLKNLFGTGRRMDVFWQKPDRLSEEFRVKYREPFILGLPLHIGGSLNRLVRDTTYIEWQYSLNTEIPLNENLTGLARFYRREVFPDSLASAILRLPQTRATHTELGLRWDTRNDFLNPRNGLLRSRLFDYGTQKNSGPSYLIEEDSLLRKTKVAKMTGQLALFFRLWRKQVLALNFNGVFIGYEGQNVQIPDMFWFGGATTVRGYRENQFFGERVGWVNIEYRFLLGPSSRIFVFNDLAFYRR
jgi:outer membrane protein insertion porin family